MPFLHQAFFYSQNKQLEPLQILCSLIVHVIYLICSHSIAVQAPDGETQPSTEVDLFISTEKIMVLNTDLKVCIARLRYLIRHCFAVT